MVTYRCDNELYHFGVKGMKWGVRKAKARKILGKTLQGVGIMANVGGFGLNVHNAFTGGTPFNKRVRRALLAQSAGLGAYALGRKLAGESGKGPTKRIQSFNRKRHLSAARAIERDARDLRKHGYMDEARAVSRVAYKERKKAKRTNKFMD